MEKIIRQVERASAEMTRADFIAQLDSLVAKLQAMRQEQAEISANVEAWWNRR
jgi:hypothetical protein